MFYVSLAAIVQFSAGMAFLSNPSKSALLFLLYWGLCVFLVFLMLLLALYDMLAVKQEQQEELVRLHSSMLKDQQKSISNADDKGNSGEA